MEREKRKAVLYDKDIRDPLFDFLEERCGKIRIIEEKTMGGCLNGDAGIDCRD